MSKIIINTDKAPSAIGPYSQAVQSNGFIYTSGMIAIDPKTGNLSTGDIEEQTRLVMDNLTALIKSAGASMGNVVKTTVFLCDMNNFAKMNVIYAEYFQTLPPARSTVEVTRLP
ncbi:MAG: Rid family detoxifying hydrolase, partial [Clostridiales bacterium]|nr:Rid family detoxifying hydrolase [Clostridiales bacterium]